MSKQDSCSDVHPHFSSYRRSHVPRSSSLLRFPSLGTCAGLVVFVCFPWLFFAFCSWTTFQGARSFLNENIAISNHHKLVKRQQLWFHFRLDTEPGRKACICLGESEGLDAAWKSSWTCKPWLVMRRTEICRMLPLLFPIHVHFRRCCCLPLTSDLSTSACLHPLPYCRPASRKVKDSTPSYCIRARSTAAHRVSLHDWA